MHVRTKFLRCIPVALLLTLAAFTLAGCSSKSASASPGETLRQASSNTAAADSVSFEMTIDIAGVMGEDMAMNADGVFDLEARQMQMTMDALGMQVEAVMDGNTMYMKIPLFGEGWFKTDLDSGGVAGNALGAGFENPTKILEWLQAAGNDVTKVGSEEVRGQPADQYRTTLNLRDAVDQLDGDARDQAEQALELLGEAEFPVNVWVNEDGLPVRLTYDMSFANATDDLLKGASIAYIIEFFDWGNPVRIDFPDPADVKELEDAMGLFGG